ERGEIDFNVALGKFYIRPEGFKTSPTDPEFLNDRVFVDNGSLVAGEQMAQLKAERERINLDLVCWNKRVDIWKRRAAQDKTPLPDPDSDEGRALSGMSFWDLPSAKAKLQACEQSITDLEEYLKEVNVRLGELNGPLAVIEGVPEESAILNAELDRVTTINDMLRRFDDPILYGMTEIIEGDFKFWRWKLGTLMDEAYRTVFYNRLPWARHKIEPHFFVETPKAEAKVPTTQTEWLQWLYAQAHVATHGNVMEIKEKKEVLFPGQTERRSGGVYSDETLALIRRELYGPDEKPGTADDFNLERFLSKDIDRRFTHHYVTVSDGNGNSIETFRRLDEAEMTETAFDRRKYKPGKGYMINEEQWVRFEDEFYRALGFTLRGESAPVRFAPFAKSFNALSGDFSAKMRAASSLDRINALDTKAKYFPAISRYQREINELREALVQYAETPKAIRFNAMTLYQIEAYEFASKDAASIRYDNKGRPDALTKEGRLIHAYIPLPYRTAVSTSLSAAKSREDVVVEHLSLSPTDIATGADSRGAGAVFANWFYNAGQGISRADRVVELKGSKFVVDPDQIDREADAAHERARLRAIAEGPDAYKEWQKKDEIRRRRVADMADDPDECPEKRRRRNAEELLKKQREDSKKPKSATLKDMAALALTERVEYRDDLLDPTELYRISKHSASRGRDGG
ncbi:MAG: hypothetical protein KDB07_06750, partial [Planctomycetes bacterium]|nr:hypothetical protein [Planctomycetota bacterium]